MDEAGFVWFRAADYAGLARRLLACLIDAAVVVGLLAAPTIIISKMNPQPPQAPTRPSAAALVVGAAFILMIATPYHVLMRRLRGGTIGYRIAGLRLTTMQDSIPTIRTLLRRFALSIVIPLAFYAVFTPLFAARQHAPQKQHHVMSPGEIAFGLVLTSVMISLLLGNYWMVPRDPRHQALHDKWSRTWVVRSSASPAGIARPIERAWVFGPVVLGYCDVEPIESARPAATTA